MKKIRILIIYVILILFFLFFNENNLHDRALCCWLYGYYEKFFLPFPIIESSQLSSWWGGPVKYLYLNIILNITIPILIFLFHSWLQNSKNHFIHPHIMIFYRDIVNYLKRKTYSIFENMFIFCQKPIIIS